MIKKLYIYLHWKIININKIKIYAMSKIGCCIIAIICIIALSFAEGYVLMLLWNWITPLFWKSSPVLTFWESMGIICPVNLIGSIIRRSFYPKTK